MQPRPPVQPKKLTPKAVQAYASELRRYHKKLIEWDARLADRTAAYEEWESMMQEDEDEVDEVFTEEEECECSEEDAMSGCTCWGCVQYRKKFNTAYPQSPVGDEIVFLEKLHQLKDKRKK